ncbi:hypothetical protein EOA22_31880 [Mesorhizobium sp. M7A.F.Ca.US.014.04.1.1]|uniref:hypothetical protein n=1 Tax=Mesorhizobium TaxID=68287 RepID=UPI0007A93F6E|nr:MULTISPECIES: hypothetical protein [Mesorhizobium]AMX97967.1 hypothetical protein A4R28_32855 [Mesorhizobium ciceri]ARP68473.1 hypothetical protein A9K65_034655 [Mesorhizobium sp. WSM1497]MDF3233740.1 hypothetical protein [Mesorhizobium sp. DSM 30133]RUU16117.1 hypothetical protein EOC84_30095 [Mesorhizobium sp. Primo-B]RUU33469.1 hypothetical protein EOC83_32265 [Mesorhizobium sp. Primo-A]
MKNARPAYVVYAPPLIGLPFLAVILALDDIATPFDTADEAAAHNKVMAVTGAIRQSGLDNHK